MKIGKFEIGTKTYIVAEIGNNHLGKPELAFKSLEVVAKIGIDAVKFQLFNPDLLVNPKSPVLKHVPNNCYLTQRERFKNMMLSRDVFIELAKRAEKLGVAFLCTPFDLDSVDFLNKLVPAFKIASGDINNIPLLEYIISKGKPILVSSGMCNQQEVDKLVSLLPKDRSVLLHCIGAYPTPDNEVCLSLIPFYSQRYNMFIGYSDHTPDTLAPLSAVALGAVVIEKHFILDKSIPGGDRDLSLDGDEMTKLVRNIRRLESMIGRVPRCVQHSENYARVNLRRCAYARKLIMREDKITMDDIVWLRPVVEEGISYEDFKNNSLLKAKETIYSEEPLTKENVELIVNPF